MKDFYNLYSIGKNTKKPDSRGKSFGYQVLGFGSGFSSAIAHRAVWGSAFQPSKTNVIDFVEIATAGNASDSEFRRECTKEDKQAKNSLY